MAHYCRNIAEFVFIFVSEADPQQHTVSLNELPVRSDPPASFAATHMSLPIVLLQDGRERSFIYLQPDELL